MPALAICAAGSLLGLHLGESSFPVGKVEYLEKCSLPIGKGAGRFGSEVQIQRCCAGG